MSEVTEALERAEHTEHAGHGHAEGHGHGGNKSSRLMGLTVAVLGVLLAICAAFVGSERTETIKELVTQAGAKSDYQADATRYRTTMAQVEALDSVDPAADPDRAKRIAAIGADAKPEHADIIAAMQASLKEQVNATGPDEDTVGRLIKLARQHKTSAEAADQWSDSFDEVVKAHYEAAEGFERAQLAAEIGIVLASVGLLLGSRAIWGVSVGVGVLGVVLAALTFFHSRKELKEGDAKVEEAKHHYDEVQKSGNAEEDEEVLKDFEKYYDVAPAASGSAEGH